MKNKVALVCAALLVSTMANAADGRVKENKNKLADDPTKVISKVGVSYANNYDFDDPNLSFSGSIAFDQARKLNARINDDASEWRIGGSWLFPVGIVNFNFGKNEYTNGANQTNYSVGTFMPLSYFGIEPLGFQIFPMAGYTYNDGEAPACDGEVGSKCTNPDFVGTPSPENGFDMMTSSGSSGYVGAFALKSLNQELTLISFAAGSYGSKNSDGENYKGAFGGVGLGYAVNKNHSFNVMTFLMNNNTYLDEADKRVVASYQYQFD
ncbi:hypothetical protein AB3Y13_05045 [Vibrio alginolyticus]|uniref:hypothetical protein n=1 Tax=Vibrio sp. B1FLJ16 TaxID=2751178 RepID=UPI0015F6D1C6|nr:hypothetical protein [Vibrio sp. B1FLJ16]CAD7820652.1 hypothetical protein ACOMICROBIO_EPCKBFOG_03915 [Vibrio sp. B1FLJ16]CAD7822115.1 hypothetical protein ACOMICROBIO_FLGHMIGD_02944 [Vibrio sp. B1FLJ16]CAE6943822.1 hypothetical protein ACOMICROBIO_EPCKBFOG_03915 [Vibrio sp. B1FLJ16]CAE6948121.1 hypothetical protein ACOMICROBIO_FLGHMIGD_02944 [Vibrio sp. B1FLJ16]